MAEASPSSPAEGAGSHESAGGNGSAQEQDGFLSIGNIIPIMRKGIPADAKIAKDAMEAMQESVSEFSNPVTSE